MSDIIPFPKLSDRPVRAIGTAENLDDAVAALVDNFGPATAIFYIYLAALKLENRIKEDNAMRGYAREKDAD